MNDTYSPTSPLPLAFYDPESSCWRTWLGTSLWGDQTSLERLPDWGMTRGGELFERPTPAPLTAVRGSSSLPLLPTSRATDGDKGGPNQVNGRGVRDSLPGVAPTLLPTPTAAEATGPGHAAQGGRNLRTEVTLLPTPAVNDMGRGKTPEQWDEWAARQKAADGRPAPHGKSLEQEAIRLLPTPRAQNGEERNQNIWARPAHLPQNLENALAHTLPPSPDGSTSPDATPPLPLNLDATGDPA